MGGDDDCYCKIIELNIPPPTGGVGKSAFVLRHRTGEFQKKYIATLGVEVHPLVFHTQYGKVAFNVWDCAGQEKYGGLRDGYYIMGQGAIIMFDLTCKQTLQSVDRWKKDFVRVCDSTAPICFVGNKADVRERAVSPKAISRHFERYGNQPLRNQRASAAATMAVLCLCASLKSDIARLVAQIVWRSRRDSIWNRAGDPLDPSFKYFDISVKSNYNFEKPFLWLARQLTGREDLMFVEAFDLRPPVVDIDPVLMAQYEQEMAAAQHMLIPTDDDDL